MHSSVLTAIARRVARARTTGAAGAAMLILAFAAPGHSWAEQAQRAEANARIIEEVVVTARKRQENLQDLPGSAAVLTAGFLDDVGGIKSLRDLTDKIPGITITEGQLPEVTEPSIRGAGQARNRMSVSATGIYRNGAYIAGRGLGGRNFTRADSYDLQQVEVYRGPQGAMYGRNALGGALHFLTQRPTDTWSGELGLTLGENDRMQYEVLMNAPLGDGWSSRFSYVRDEYDDGFYRDVDGNPVDTALYQHGRGSLTFRSERLEANYVYDYMDDEGTPAINVNQAPVMREANDNDFFQTLINTEHSNQHKVHNHNLQLDYPVDMGTLSLVSNYRDRDLSWERDPDHDGGNLNLATRPNVNINQTDEEMYYNELRFVSDGTSNTRWVLGADHYKSDTSESVIVFFPLLIDTTTNLFNDPTGLVYDSFIDVRQKSWAVFTQLEHEFEEVPLTLSGEVRYAEDDVSGDVATFQPFQGCAQTLGEDPCTAVDDERKYRNMPWTMTASWDIQSLPEVLASARAYAKVASSYRHGGLNLSAGLPSNAFPVKPTYGEEKSLTYEIGLKSAWIDNRVLFNISVFFTEYEDFLNTTTNGCPDLCPFLDPENFQSLGYNPDGSRVETNANGEEGVPSGVSFFIDNIGDVEAWGFEAELQTNTSVGAGVLETSLGYSRQRGDIKSINPDVSPANEELDGERLNKLRPNQVKANARYGYPIAFGGARNLHVFAAATWVYESGGLQELPPAGGTPRSFDDVSRLDIRMGIEGERWELFLEGRNVTDETYILNEEANGIIRVSDPSHYSAGFKWRFN